MVNTSGTLAAAVDALGDDGTPLVVHLSQRLPAGLWLVELRRPNGRATEPWFDEPPGRTLRLVGGGFVHLATRFESSTRLWVATLELPDPGAHVPRGARPADPLRLRHPRLAARHVPERVRARTRERGDAERRTSVHARAGHAARRQGSRRHAARAPHRRVVARGERAPVPRVVPRSAVDRGADQRDPRQRRPRDRDRHDRRARARVGRRRTARRARRRGLDRRGRHAASGARTRSTACSPAGTNPRRHTCRCSRRSRAATVLDVSYAAASAEGYLWHEFGDVHLILP